MLVETINCVTKAHYVLSARYLALYRYVLSISYIRCPSANRLWILSNTLSPEEREERTPSQYWKYHGRTFGVILAASSWCTNTNQCRWHKEIDIGCSRISTHFCQHPYAPQWEARFIGKKWSRFTSTATTQMIVVLQKTWKHAVCSKQDDPVD